MDHIHALYLNNNTLYGTLPDAWSHMRKLQYLDLSGNTLSGTLPAAWTALNHLYSFSINGNQGVCGAMPSGTLNESLTSSAGTMLGHACPPPYPSPAPAGMQAA